MLLPDWFHGTQLRDEGGEQVSGETLPERRKLQGELCNAHHRPLFGPSSRFSAAIRIAFLAVGR